MLSWNIKLVSINHTHSFLLLLWLLFFPQIYLLSCCWFIYIWIWVHLGSTGSSFIFCQHSHPRWFINLGLNTIYMKITLKFMYKLILLPWTTDPCVSLTFGCLTEWRCFSSLCCFPKFALSPFSPASGNDTSYLPNCSRNKQCHIWHYSYLSHLFYHQVIWILSSEYILNTCRIPCCHFSPSRYHFLSQFLQESSS